MLVRYLAALGVEVDAPGFWIGGVLIQEHVDYASRTSTLDEIRREFGFTTAS